MRVASLCAGLALVAVLTACGGGRAREEAPPKQTFHPPAGDLLGLVWNRNSAELTKLDPRTLAPRSARVDVGDGTLIASSPDGGTLAVTGGEDGEINLVDLRTFRPLGVVELGIPGYISRLSWSSRQMLFAAVGQQFVVVIDAAGRKVYETRQVEGTLLAAEPLDAGMLGLVAPADPDKFGVADALRSAHIKCPAIVIGSVNDPWMDATRAAYWADNWRCGFVNAGSLGHINAESGLGDWEQGLQQFGYLLDMADTLAAIGEN